MGHGGGEKDENAVVELARNRTLGQLGLLGGAPLRLPADAPDLTEQDGVLGRPRDDVLHGVEALRHRQGQARIRRGDHVEQDQALGGLGVADDGEILDGAAALDALRLALLAAQRRGGLPTETE